MLNPLLEKQQHLLLVFQLNTRDLTLIETGLIPQQSYTGITSVKMYYLSSFGFDPTAFIQEVVADPSNPELMLTALTDMMFPETPSDERKQYFIDTFLFDGGSLLQEGTQSITIGNLFGVIIFRGRR